MPRPPPKRHALDPSDAPETLSSSLSVLSSYRTLGVRDSQDVVSRGEAVLKRRGALAKMGDEVWPFLEQLGFAALDIGKTELATICIQRLEKKFPDSPRVDALHGLLLELQSPPSSGVAREFYESRLSADENNVLVRKRLIALHLHAPKGDAHLSIHRGIELLVEHLDTVYTDAEGWSELAHAYERLGLLQQSLACVADLILLQPTQHFHLLRHAELLYTLGSYSLAYAEFCRVLEMAGPPSDGGLGRRACFGIKMCLGKLGHAGAWPKKGKEMEALVTQELLKAYAKDWSGPGDRVAGHDESKMLKIWLARSSSSSGTGSAGPIR